MNNSLGTLRRWFDTRTHKERIGLLLLGFACIYLVWYITFAKPAKAKRKQLHQKIQAIQVQITTYQKTTEKIQNIANANMARIKVSPGQESTTSKTAIQIARREDKDKIISTILTPTQNVSFIDFKNTSVLIDSVDNKQPIHSKKQKIQITFLSNYMDTINYLHALERLPWCISWESLEYKVTNYPQGIVGINLNIASM